MWLRMRANWSLVSCVNTGAQHRVHPRVKGSTLSCHVRGGPGLERAPVQRVSLRQGSLLQAKSHQKFSRLRRETRVHALGVCDVFNIVDQCPDTSRALALATLAGLSTAIGGAASVVRQPDNAALAFLLGTAIGVMATLSVIEMWLNNALEHGFFEVTACAALGALLYAVLGPLVPEVELPMGGEKMVVGHRHASGQDLPAPDGDAQNQGEAQLMEENGDSSEDEDRRRKLMRLGLLMAVTMTLHNLPEGFAVAFASFTDFGPKMAFAVAMHNIPEGIIVSAPIFASTGSRTLAIGMSVASGLSEPVGAVIALAALGPHLTPDGLQLVLATVGGIMTAVCVLELLPEGRKCNADSQLALGGLVGSAVMGATLAAGV